ncbi:MAG: GNAT family N-acetyltransferase [Burkholderiales bacterium]|nr:GNAT family N-acetyltransferase [Burkholderiales bacterium]MCE7878531.1 GNAT family N-acetyltransferase [Betaproteobacteria bacterium PRO3]
MNPGFAVRPADFEHDAEALREIRIAVFCIEQDVPPELEWDGVDPRCEHALAVDAGGRAIGCGRLLPDGHIGRMAVLREWRGRGVGGALLEHFVALARTRGHTVARLNAQVHAIPFYRAHGFAVEGDEFEEAGIPHRAMARSLG